MTNENYENLYMILSEDIEFYSKYDTKKMETLQYVRALVEYAHGDFLNTFLEARKKARSESV